MRAAPSPVLYSLDYHYCTRVASRLSVHDDVAAIWLDGRGYVPQVDAAAKGAISSPTFLAMSGMLSGPGIAFEVTGDS